MTSRSHTFRAVAPALVPPAREAVAPTVGGQLLYVSVGVLLGIVFVKSEVLSWYRIQEMFRFQSAHMYRDRQRLSGRDTRHSGSAVEWPSHLERRSDHDSAERDDLSGRSILAWRHGLRSGVGVAGCVPGADFFPDRAGVTSMSVALLSALAGT